MRLPSHGLLDATPDQPGVDGTGALIGHIGSHDRHVLTVPAEVDVPRMHRRGVPGISDRDVRMALAVVFELRPWRPASGYT